MDEIFTTSPALDKFCDPILIYLGTFLAVIIFLAMVCNDLERRTRKYQRREDKENYWNGE